MPFKQPDSRVPRHLVSVLWQPFAYFLSFFLFFPSSSSISHKYRGTHVPGGNSTASRYAHPLQGFIGASVAMQHPLDTMQVVSACSSIQGLSLSLTFAFHFRRNDSARICRIRVASSGNLNEFFTKHSPVSPVNVESASDWEDYKRKIRRQFLFSLIRYKSMCCEM